MRPLSRRTFLQLSTVSAAAALSRSTWARAAGANEAIRVAVVGFASKGAGHIRQLLRTPGVRISALCDVDPAILAREVAFLKTQEVKVFSTTDARHLLTRDDVDALLIATSTHWHALLAIWACQAGKDVYVEKPVSRTIWEGRKMIEAAQRYGRIVQSGTQLRSDSGIAEAVQLMRSGELGRVQSIHALAYSLRESIGRREPWYPDHLDYELFCGPTPVVPLERQKLHYDWHWMWATGNGDMSNLGVHALDIARRFVGDASRPRGIVSVGGRFARDDVAETPNTQLAFFDYPEVPVTFESRGLPAQPGTRTMDQYRGIRSGVVVQCEGGYYAGYIGGALYDKDGRQLRKIPGDGGARHLVNFLEAMRSRRAQDLAAPIETGHTSTAICHYANVSYRIGRRAAPEVARQAFAKSEHAQAGFDRMKQHLVAHGIDLERDQLQVGCWLTPDPETDGVTSVGNGDERTLQAARFLLKEAQRPAFAIPERV